METDPPPPKPEDLEKCSRILDTFECLIIKESRLTANQHLLDSMDNGIMRLNHDSYSMILKEVRNLTEEIEELKSELTLIGFCPIEDCQHHSKINAPIIAQKLKDSSKKLELDLKKVEKYPKTSSKLSGEYLRIFATSIEERNEIIDFLKGKGEQFFALHPQDVKIQKIVIKGLPISADIDDIKQDLSEQGFLVSKVAQLTKNKSKFKLPIFMVELQKSPDSPDIFKLEKCCYLTVKIDTFNRRPGPTQCYNCNLFNHSSKNCHIKTRCLKCGDPHKTGECPIKDLIENPVCINCNKTGHLANSHRCEKYPKIQPKKGAPLNRNKPQNSFNSDQSKVKNDISFANALKGNQQMAPLPENPVPLIEPETAPAPPQEEKKSKCN
ncbi:nucleic-acid-binding protein from transposon X-element [Trichonephila clavipes]|nr:nucleic-acid-binding protein from transposon X-element [Trichonephila clavipes]